jgi:hypothetical protein
LRRRVTNTIPCALPLGVVYDDLSLAKSQETSLLMVHALQIIDRACKITRHALRFGVQ